ncbi:MAG TPA: hypothetical protein VGY56_22070 [Verrucomicrobiae bacterium]|nr:hypothetical protein [Verrucomicrobiae bacterium]
MKFDAAELTKIDSMSAADYVQHERELHHHSYIYHFISILVFGGFYIGAVEFIALLIESIFPRKPDA